MKKSFYSFLFLFAAMFAWQHVSAQEAATIYTVDFTKNSFEGWTPEGDYVDKGAWDASEGALVAYAHMATGACTSKLVSPSIKLGASNNTVSFRYQGFYFGDITKEAELVIREEGGEWTNIVMNYPPADDYSIFNTGEMPVPEQYNGKNVQFAFKYSVSTTEFIGYWCIQDFNVKGVMEEAPVEKADAGISYDVTEVTYTIGDPDFVAPVLNNPNNLEAYYSSENESVAIIETDGSLTIVGPGKALIRALTLETEKFKKGEASYTLTVVDPEIVFMAKFDVDECGFVEEIPAEQNNAWMHFWDGCMSADGYQKVDKFTPFYLVSPEFTLDAVGNVVSFDHKGDYFTNWEEEAQLCIREVGGEWINITGITYPTSGTEYTNSGILEIPAQLNGKNVQIAFKYSADGSMSSGIWYVDNLLVKRFVPTGISDVKAADKDNIIYDLQGRRVNKAAMGIYIVNGKKIVLK